MRQRGYPFKPPIGTLPIGPYGIGAGLVGCFLLQEGTERALNYANPNNTFGRSSGTAPTIATSPWGLCAKFGGAGGYNSPQNHAVGNVSSPGGIPAVGAGAGAYLTFIARVNPASISGFDSIYANASTGFFLNAGKFQFFSMSASTATLSTGVWTTVACVAHGGSAAVDYYINGLFDSTRTLSGSGWPDNQNTTCIGTDTAGEHFDGYIDYIAFWNRPMTADEIATISADPFTAMFGAPDPLTLAIATAAPGTEIGWLITDVSLPAIPPRTIYGSDGMEWPIFAGPAVARVLQVPTESAEQSTSPTIITLQAPVETVEQDPNPSARVFQAAVECVYPFRCTPALPTTLPNACPAPELAGPNTQPCADDIPTEEFN